MTRFKVYVGNIGQVYDGDNETVAYAAYREYKSQSQATGLRASGEDVTLFDGEEIRSEYVADYGECL